MTQDALRKAAGVSIASVRRLEYGERIDRKIERKVGTALGIGGDGVDRVHAGERPEQRGAAPSSAIDVLAARQDELLAISEEELLRMMMVVRRVFDAPTALRFLDGARELRREAERQHKRDIG